MGPGIWNGEQKSPRQKLEAAETRIRNLEAMVEKLRAENAELRKKGAT